MHTGPTLGSAHRLKVGALMFLYVLALPMPLRCNRAGYNIELAGYQLLYSHDG
jgi:hypothetical protein